MFFATQLALISIYSGIAYLLIQPFSNWLMLSLGLVLGFLFLLFDKKVAFKFYINNQQLGQSIGLITRSIIFLFAYIPLALFVITSSGSPMGSGMIVAMGFTYLFELWQLRNNPALFAEKFLWQTGNAWSRKEVKMFVRIFIIIILLLSVLTLT